MKSLFLLVFTILNYQPLSLQPDSQIYFGSYCLKDQETHWDLKLISKIFSFKCRETGQEYYFKYNRCSSDDESVKICSSDDQLAELKFFELKEIHTCEGEDKRHFSKIVFTHGSNTSDSGEVCCDN